MRKHTQNLNFYQSKIKLFHEPHTRRLWVSPQKIQSESLTIWRLVSGLPEQGKSRENAEEKNEKIKTAHPLRQSQR